VVADEVAEEYSQGNLNLISCILHIISGGNSIHEDTSKDINKIECVTCEVKGEVADEVAGEYS
jgi:hypothetical protein